MRYADLGNGRFQNPILFADYSDPDVIRVGDTYYMTASSFNYTPGLPILISKDLVNWKLVNYAIENIAEERYAIPRHSEGVWAPAIRYHDGMFYIYYGMPDEGYYVVRTKDPLGKWEEPVCILPGKGLIDPCLFWDEDGKAYIIHGYAKSRIGFKSILGIFEMSSDGMKAISEDHFIFDGNDPEHRAVTIEGPKVYKRNGFYYILAPAGGVRQGYQVALRSKDIHGPYEIKTVMAQGNTVINGPHQGGLVDTEKGDEWFIHFQDRGLYGRICHLQPVHWENNWPVIGVNPTEEGCGEPVYEMEMPGRKMGGTSESACDESRELVLESADCCKRNNGEFDTPSNLESTDCFTGGKYGLQWQWLGNHRDDFFGKTEESNGLRLFALNPSGDENPTLWRSANVLTQKMIYPVFEASIQMDASHLEDGERAGVCMTGGQYIVAAIERTGNSYDVVVLESKGSDSNKTEAMKARIPLSEISSFSGGFDESLQNICFKMSFTCDKIDSEENLYFRNVTETDERLIPHLRISLVVGGQERDLGVLYTPSDHTWVGAKIGIFALACKGSGQEKHGFADFNSVTVEEL